MEIDYLTTLWTNYRSRPVDMTIHPDDGMYVAARNPKDYEVVGEASIRTIVSMLAAQAQLYDVRKILDFGCGHGRVGRHLRAFFPQADILFSDVDPSCPEFCAKTFNGRSLVTPKAFDDIVIEGSYDLIWLGSVFTHIDYDRMQVLFDKLFERLTPNGLLVGSFRGEKMYRAYMGNERATERDTDLLAQYEAEGVGYQRYKDWEDDWGLSLISPQKLIDLGQRHASARVVGFTEMGWAAAHDVIGWTNRSPKIDIP